MGGQMARKRKLAVWAMFLHSKQQKSYQGTLGTLELTPIGSRASLGPSIDPTGPLSWTLFSSIFGENPKKLKIRYLEIRCFVEKSPPGTLNGPIGPIFLDRTQDKRQT